MSASTLAAAPFPGRSGGINAPAALGAGALLLAGAAAIDQAVSHRQVALYLLGAALGLVLYHAAFGFTSAWRIFIADRRGEGLRAQMVMLAVAVVLFFPVLAAGTLFGQPVQGFVSPVGVSVVFGAFLFGIGIVLGVLGALLAAALAGRFAPNWRVPLRSAVAAVAGGLMLGYGARLAYGCNIGAYFSGIASGSLHGWPGWRPPSSATSSAPGCARPSGWRSSACRGRPAADRPPGRGAGYLRRRPGA